MNKFGTIYKITNTLNNKVYIGQTVFACEIRWNQHKNEFKNSAIHSALSKYGSENFLFEEIYTSFSKEDFNSVSPNGYNLTLGGDKVYLSEESKQKISKTKTGKPNTNRKPIKMINVITGEERVLTGTVEVKQLGLDPSLVRSCLCGLRNSHKGFRFERVNNVNQSGSTKSNNLGHAQRLGSETEQSEYNLPTSSRHLSKYARLQEQIIALYIEHNSSYKVASILNLDKSSVCKWLKTWGKLNTQSQASTNRNNRKYSKMVR
jgi:hypothetical protein